MLESLQKSNVVQSIKGCGHVESSENCNFCGINGFHDIICELYPFATSDAYMRQLFHCLQWYAGSERVKQSSLSRMKFTISWLKRRKTGRFWNVRKKTWKGKTLKDFADGIQIWYWSEICKIWLWQTRFFQQRWDKYLFELEWKNGLGERLVCQVWDKDGESVGTLSILDNVWFATTQFLFPHVCLGRQVQWNQN